MFKNNYIHINDTGIDLLRNNYPLKHFDFFEIDKFIIKDGFLLRNRLLILSFGFIMIISGLILFFNEFDVILDIFNFKKFYHFSRGLGLIIILPLFLIIFGILISYQSFLKSKILVFESNSKKYEIRLKEFELSDKIDDINNFLKYKIYNTK